MKDCVVLLAAASTLLLSSLPLLGYAGPAEVECVQPQACPLRLDPVCTVDGEVLMNRCFFDAYKCRSPESQETSCFASPLQKSFKRQATPFSSVGTQLVGGRFSDDGIWQWDSVHQQSTIKRAASSPRKRKPNASKTKDDCDNLECYKIFLPVCGSDGKTYSNECVLNVTRCEKGPSTLRKVRCK